MDIDTLAIAGPALGLAGVLGYAAHRGGICAVKAVGELFTTRRTFMFRSFLKAIAWVAAITWPLLLWGSDAMVPPAGWEVDAWVLIGGFVFGIGATINRGCAFSTLARLGDGNLTMILALAGIAGGAGIAFSIPSFPAALDLRFRVGVPPETTLLAILGLTGLWLWCVWEIWRLWESRAAGPLGDAFFGSTAFRLSVAALIVGGINGVLIPLTGGWAYVGTIATAVADLIDVPTPAGPPSPMRWWLLGAALFGMVVSSLQRGTFRLRAGPPSRWVTPLIGGGAMGFGAALTPGGNEYLILQGIPCFSPHAFIGLISLVAGIVAAMIVSRMFGGSLAVIDCSGDICRTRDA